MTNDERQELWQAKAERDGLVIVLVWTALVIAWLALFGS